MLGKNLVQKWLLANETSVFFNRQYFINRLISDFLGPKMAHPYNSGCAVRMFF